MHKFLLLSLIFTTTVMAQKNFGYLQKEDQKYFKNDMMEGNNQYERIDLNVKEINKLHGEINSLKSEISQLKEEIEKLKKKNNP